MTDEDESTDPGMIGAERAILKFLRGREANEAIASHEGSRAAHFMHNLNFDGFVKRVYVGAVSANRLPLTRST